MDRLSKELRKLSRKELERIRGVLESIKTGAIDTLQVKQMRGFANTYRVRVGRLRVVYEVLQDGTVKLLVVRKRDDNTYRDF